jgi:DNA-binding transcriptional ArsR family regulator
MLMTAKIRSVDLQAKLFRGFADPSRLSVLVALRNGPLTVGEIVEATGLSQSNASNHLGVCATAALSSRSKPAAT